jgi:hypothetical protein
MGMRRIYYILVLGMLIFFSGLYGVPAAGESKEQKAQAAAKTIDTAATADSNHPEIPAGVSCNDCHEIKIDANTTATQVWLSGESPGRKAGEGLMPKDKLWQAILKIIGGKKKDSKTFVLGTCLNNVPLTSTAEFTLDPDKKMLYGFHEAGTEKLAHIKNNPKVSLNWHREFETFTDYWCLQIKGHAELLEGNHPDFEKLLVEFLPYEDGARVPADATPQQREERLKQFRDGLAKGAFVISRITIDQITAASVDFTKEGFRRYQRWTR